MGSHVDPLLLMTVLPISLVGNYWKSCPMFLFALDYSCSIYEESERTSSQDAWRKTSIRNNPAQWDCNTLSASKASSPEGSRNSAFPSLPNQPHPTCI